MIMSRTLRSGTRRDYKKMVDEKSEHESDDADEESDGLVVESKEESNNDHDDSEASLALDGVEEQLLGESVVAVNAKKKEGKSEKNATKLKKLMRELKEVEERVSKRRKGINNKGQSSKSMKDVEMQVNRMLDRSNDSRSGGGKKKSSKRSKSKRYVFTSSESDSSSSSHNSSSTSDGDSSSCSSSRSSSSDSCDKRKKNRKKSSKSKNKKSYRKINRRSGKNRKISSHVKFPQKWPHSHLSLHYVSKNKKYDELSIQEFCAGFATILENTRSSRELKHRISHLKDLMYLATKYRWDCVLNFHAACLLEVERGHIRWGDSFQSLQITTLAGGFIQSNSAPLRGTVTRSNEVGPISFCKNFQRGLCDEDGDHQGELNGSTRLLRHICAKCWLHHRKKASHPEDSEDCPSRISN